MYITPLLIQYDLALNADSFMLLFYSISIYKNWGLFIINHSYYFWGLRMYYSTRAFLIESCVDWCSRSWKHILYSLTFVYNISLACQFMQLCVVLHWGAFTKECHLHDKTSSLMTWFRYGNYTFINTRPLSYKCLNVIIELLDVFSRL